MAKRRAAYRNSGRRKRASGKVVRLMDNYHNRTNHRTHGLGCGLWQLGASVYHGVVLVLLWAVKRGQLEVASDRVNGGEWYLECMGGYPEHVGYGTCRHLV